MYDVKPNLIIGFHGCEASVRDSLLKNPNEIKISQKPFDWLGHGLYFWENNYERALQWHLDCAAIEFMHAEIFDQVQGGPAFQGAGLFAKSHIQICVRNPNCIQGFFMPREEIDFIMWLEQNKPVNN